MLRSWYIVVPVNDMQVLVSIPSKLTRISHTFSTLTFERLLLLVKQPVNIVYYICKATLVIW